VREHGYLLSAAFTLYQGANNSGLIPFGHLPDSMLVVGGTVALLETPSASRFQPTAKPRIEEPPIGLARPPKQIGEFGDILNNSEVGIIWGKGIKQQGIGQGDTGWEAYVARQYPGAKRLRPGAKGFDVFDESTGEAVNAKTMNTQSMSYIRNPQQIFQKLQRYVDAAVNYERRTEAELDPAQIEIKTTELAIPEYTSPEQWRQLLRAIIYGKENGVTIVIKRIRK
jgi:hypothetical protein